MGKQLMDAEDVLRVLFDCQSLVDYLIAAELANDDDTDNKLEDLRIGLIYVVEDAKSRLDNGEPCNTE